MELTAKNVELAQRLATVEAASSTPTRQQVLLPLLIGDVQRKGEKKRFLMGVQKGKNIINGQIANADAEHNMFQTFSMTVYH